MTIKQATGLDVSMNELNTQQMLDTLNTSLSDSKQINSTENALKVINQFVTVYEYKFNDEEKALILLWLLNNGLNSVKKKVQAEIIKQCKDKDFVKKVSTIAIKF